MNQSKYEDHDNEGAVGANAGFFSINIHIPSFFVIFLCTYCWDCVSQVLLEVQKAFKKALAHNEDHLECSLRPIEATQMTPGQFQGPGAAQ